jgi:hypothetical protein
MDEPKVESAEARDANETAEGAAFVAATPSVEAAPSLVLTQEGATDAVPVSVPSPETDNQVRQACSPPMMMMMMV